MLLNAKHLALCRGSPLHQGLPAGQEAGDGLVQRVPPSWGMGGGLGRGCGAKAEVREGCGLGAESGGPNQHGEQHQREGHPKSPGPCTMPPTQTLTGPAPGQGRGDASWGVCYHREPCSDAFTNTPTWTRLVTVAERPAHSGHAQTTGWAWGTLGLCPSWLSLPEHTQQKNPSPHAAMKSQQTAQPSLRPHILARTTMRGQTEPRWPEWTLGIWPQTPPSLPGPVPPRAGRACRAPWRYPYTWLLAKCLCIDAPGHGRVMAAQPAPSTFGQCFHLQVQVDIPSGRKADSAGAAGLKPQQPHTERAVQTSVGAPWVLLGSKC